MAIYTEKSKKLEAFTTSVKKMTDSKLSEIEGTVKSNATTIADHTDMMKNAIEIGVNENTEFFSNINNIRSNAMSDISEISGSVEMKKVDLNTTIQEVCANLDKATDEACIVVSNTSQTANKVLKDISDATEGMRSSSYGSIDNFTALLDGK